MVDWRAPGDEPRVYAVYVDAADKVWVSEWSAQACCASTRDGEVRAFRSSSRTAERAPDPWAAWEVVDPESAADKITVYRYK